MHGIIRKTKDFITANNLLPQRCSIVVGLSGGPDSVALLRVLLELRDRNAAKWRIFAAHLNHGIRKREAELDARFCEECCSGPAVPFAGKFFDVPALAKKQRLSLEEAARQARFDFFADVARQIFRGDDRRPVIIATGHHLDDQAETVLLRILRGTGVLGLGGIPASRKLEISGIRKPTMLVRPLLAVSRDEILEYLRDIRQPYRTDRSNASVKYTRNRIRNEILPLLRRRINPRVTRALANLASIAQQWTQALEDLDRRDLLCEAEGEPKMMRAGKGAVRLSAKALAELPSAAGQHALRTILAAHKIPLKKMKAEHFRRILSLAADPAPRTAQLPDKLDARRDGGQLIIEGRAPVEPLPRRRKKSYALKLGRTNEISELGLRISVKALPLPRARRAKIPKKKTPLEEVIDDDKLSGPLRARFAEKGDVFRPLGHKGQTALSRFLAKQRLHSRRRKRTVVVCDKKRIVWVAGVRISEDVKVTDSTRRAIRLRAGQMVEHREK